MNKRKKYFLILILTVFYSHVAHAGNKLICSHSVVSPMTYSEGIKAEIRYCDSAISDKGNRCGATINNIGVTETFPGKFIDGNTGDIFGTGNIPKPSTEGVCKIFIPSEVYSMFGIAGRSENYEKPIPIKLYISPTGCPLGVSECSDFVNETVTVPSSGEIPPPNKLICSSKFTSPATRKTGITGEISICSEFIQSEKSMCSLYIKDQFFYYGPPNNQGIGKCLFNISPTNYLSFGITPEDYGKTIPISLVFSPSGCIEGDPICSEAADGLIFIEDPLTLITKALTEMQERITEDCKGIIEGLLTEYEETHIRATYTTANKIIQIVNHYKWCNRIFSG